MTHQADAAAMLRRLLDAVKQGELTADGAQGSRLLRRMEGAITALEATNDSTKPARRTPKEKAEIAAREPAGQCLRQGCTEPPAEGGRLCIRHQYG